MMKVFSKNLRKITVDGVLFYYVIDEKDYNVVIRVYSSKYKSSFFEVYFDWKEYFYINFNRPKICSELIVYALNNGWNYTEKDGVMRLLDGGFLIKKLSLDTL